MGVVSCFGNDVDTFYDRCAALLKHLIIARVLYEELQRHTELRKSLRTCAHIRSTTPVTQRCPRSMSRSCMRDAAPAIGVAFTDTPACLGTLCSAHWCPAYRSWCHHTLERRWPVITPFPLCSLLAGKSGVEEISRFDASAFPTKFAAQIKDFSPDGCAAPLQPLSHLPCLQQQAARPPSL